MITAIYDRSPLNVGDPPAGLDLLKQHLKIKTDTQDALLTFYMRATLRVADDHCQNTFIQVDVDEDTGDETETILPIPEQVDMFVLQRVARYYEDRNTGTKRVSIDSLGSKEYFPEDFEILDGCMCFRI